MFQPRAQERPPYDYFAAPDGEDIKGKLQYLVKPATFMTVLIGTGDVMVYSKPIGYMGTLARYAYWAIPIFGISTAFVVASNIAGSVRNEDDEWNWAIGGATAGSVLGAWRRSPQVASVFAGAFAAVGAARKYAYKNGIDPIPTKMVQRMHGGVFAVRHDYSLLPDKTGEWRKKYEE